MKAFFNRANTPDRRVGALLILVCGLTLFISAVYWNINERLFIYMEKQTGTSRIMKPSTVPPEGYEWREKWENFGQPGWGLYDIECLSNSRKSKYDFKLYSQCLSDFIPHDRWEKTYFGSSFDGFIRESFDRHSGYFFNAPSFVLLTVGVTLYFGWARRLKDWIMSGE